MAIGTGGHGGARSGRVHCEPCISRPARGGRGSCCTAWARPTRRCCRRSGLARDHRVIAPDLPGFGDSGKPLRAYHAEFFARWLGGCLDAMGLDPADVIGNSMGGRVALEMGLRWPDRAGRLVLIML